MPPVWVGLETGGKAADKEHGAGDCSDDRDIEAWIGRREGVWKVRKQCRSAGETGSRIIYLKASFYINRIIK